MLVIVNKPRTWTKEGLQRLGELIRASREELGRKSGKSKISQRDLENYILERVGKTIHNTTLSGVERASQAPSWDTLAILEAAQFILHKDGTPYTAEELSAIAQGVLFADDSAESNDDSNTIGKSKVVHQDQDMSTYQFEYLIFRRLKALMVASQDQLGMSKAQYIQAAVANSVDIEKDTEKAAISFYNDIVEENNTRLHSHKCIEAFLPLLFRIKNPRNGLSLDTSRTYAGDFQGLIADLSQLGNGFAVKPVHH